MIVATDTLADIVARSSSIQERLHTDWLLPIRDAENDSLVKQRLVKWQKTIDKHNNGLFEKRLAWDGLEEVICQYGLREVRWPDHAPLPNWACLFQECLETMTPEFYQSLAQGNGDVTKLPIPETPIPYEEILLPFVQVVSRHLHRRTKHYADLLSPNAYAGLFRALLRQLSWLCSQALHFEFSLKRMAHNTSYLYRFQNQQHQASNHLYKQFIKEMFAGSIRQFFQKYPVLARLVGINLNLWLEANVEFMNRLATDWHTIEKTFSSTKLDQVERLDTHLSDPHNNGRTVYALSFNTGLRVIYKPKNLSLDRSYFQLLAWFNNHNFPLPFKLLKLVNRSDYGWVEYIESVPCQSEEAAERYYLRAGALLCLWYLLGGTDCHFENLIACGEHPMAIDMETLMYHHPKPRNGVNGGVYSQFLNSVLSTGMLPEWHIKDGISYDASAFGKFEGFTRKIEEWSNINKDGMDLQISAHTRHSDNVPYLHNEPLDSDIYLDEIVQGFQLMYEYFMSQHEALLGMGMFESLSENRVRFLFRNTATYETLLRLSIHPKYLRNGVDRSILFDSLSKPLLLSEAKPSTWPILVAEINALEQRDIPLFTACPKSNALFVQEDTSIPDYFLAPSYNQVIARIRNMGSADLRRQISLIRTSFQTRQASEISDTIVVTESIQLKGLMLPQSSALIKEAADIAQFICQQAVIMNGRASWAGMKYSFEAQRFLLTEVGFDLYDGICGIALFLAALDKVTGQATYQEMIFEQILSSLRDMLWQTSMKEVKDWRAQQASLGGAIGLGSMVYALTKISQLTGQTDLLLDACEVSSLITPDRIAADGHLDLLLGSAGAMLSVLALFEVTHDKQVLATAVACGNHLLQQRVLAQTGYHAWPTTGGRLLTGLSHGAAGIAYALLRLYRVTHDERYLHAALEGFAYERSVFSHEAGNWPDLRREQPKFDTNRWCSGAPGIGLARIASLSIVDTPEIREDIETALTITQEATLSDLDHPCCGNLGRIEILQLAAQWKNDHALHELTQQQTAWVLARKQGTGGFRLSSFFESVYQPTFHQGLAGIGYTLLRMACPDLPMVLVWE